jgi:hypothetical protein
MSSRATKPNWLARLSLAAVTLLVTACQDYAQRRDTIAFHAGEAVAYNKAVHTIDPWPAASARTDIDYNGERAIKAIARYEASGDVPPPPAGMTINVPMPAAAAPPH